MANVYRLIIIPLFLLFGLLQTLTSVADAFTASRNFRISYAGQNFEAPTRQGTCDSFYAFFGPLSAPRSTTHYVENNNCIVWYTDNNTLAASFSFSTNGAYYCPENGSLNGTECTCNAGFSEQDNQCVAPSVNAQQVCNDAQIGFAAGNGGQNASQVYAGNIDDGLTACFQPYPDQYPTVGCTKHFEKDLAWQNDNGSWSTRGRWHMSSMGNTSNAVPCAVEGDTPQATPENPLANPAPTPCINGYQGSVNGVSTCVPNVGKNGVDFSPSKTTEEDGSKIVDTTEEYRCEGGKCTTTTTTVTTDKSTNATTTETKTKEQTDKDFCKDPKHFDKCASDGTPKYGGNGAGDGDGDKESGSKFGGTCSAGFTCEGDAIQCAMAKEQHRFNCEQTQGYDAERNAYVEAKSAGDVFGSATNGLAGNRTVDISSYLNGVSDEFLTGRGICPPDRTISTAYFTVTIPYSTICPYLALLGNVFVVITSLISMRILFARSK